MVSLKIPKIVALDQTVYCIMLIIFDVFFLL